MPPFEGERGRGPGERRQHGESRVDHFTADAVAGYDRDKER